MKTKIKTTSEQKLELHAMQRALPWNKRLLKLVLAGAVLGALASLTVASGETNTVTLPAGTVLLVKLDQAVTSSDKPGTKFSGVLQSDLSSNGVVAVKTGSAVHGEVMDAKKAKRVRGKASVVFELNQVNINGQLTAIATEPIENIAASSTKKVAKSAAKGAAIGAIADGGDGAAKGAAIGAGASAIKKGESAGTQAGAILEFKLSEPLTVKVSP
jgi:hypothetical protein